MKVAKGTFSLIFLPFILECLFLVLFIFFKEELIGIIFIFIAFVLFLITFFFIIFFRDPEREIGREIVACADGKIREICELKDKEVGNSKKISTFMNLHNVHVNRMPYSGTIKDISHKKGSHMPAFNKDSEKNEQVIIIVDSEIGIFKIVQIAGTFARRIVPYVKKGEKVKKGERIGIIRFGSRVDVYFPLNKLKNINIKLGDRVKAGEDKIAEINA